MAIKVPIVSEFNPKGVNQADQSLKAFGISSKVTYAAIGAAAFKAFQAVDAGYDKIVVGTGATGKALEALKNDAREVANTVPNSFGEVGAAIAEVNTRLGLTGKPLQEVTKQFLDLSRITGTDVTTNIANVTRVFGDWNIATEDQAGALDMMFRATQLTGISLDKLTQTTVQYGAPLRQLGFTVEQSIALFAKWEKEGVNTETALAGLRIGLGKMARAGEEPIDAFRRIVSGIQDAGSAGEANKLALEAFGQRAGPDMAAAIREGRFEIDELVNSLEESHGSIAQATKDTWSLTDSFGRLKNQGLAELAPSIEEVDKAIVSLDNVIQSATGSSKGLGGVLAGGLKQALFGTTATARDMVDEMGHAADAAEGLAGGTRQLDSVVQDIKDHYAGLYGATQEQTEAQDEQKTSAEELRDQLAEMVAQQAASEKAAREHTAALQAQADAADKLIGKKTALVGGDIAVRAAQRSAREAAAELNEELGNQDRTMDSVAEATDDAAGAYLRAADAAVDFAVDQLEANGTAVSAEERSRLLKDELARLAAGVDGPLREALQRYIDDLNRIPAQKNTTVTTTVKTVNIVSGGARPMPGMAADTGGVVPGAVGSPQMILAHGGEKILPMHRSDAAARATIEAAMGGGGGGGGGVVINVTAGMGTDGRQVGRQIVDALREFKRAGGNVSV